MQLSGESTESSPRVSRMLSTLSATFWILALGIITLFAFLVAMGAFNPTEVVAVTVFVGVLAVLWIGHAFWVSRHSTGRNPDEVRDRERRGF